ncbi:uncharacterized protein LOC119766588 [Culex quinquefasciatus]|uniref:uncharacterized protein LOC119766588 n=1 Tax=Culex quinquefasciatus TaxID=7176 RepID=UPI0018E3E5BF|nr:uncharacterized protein LOC119766588 [Culex quinquefasciatus]
MAPIPIGQIGKPPSVPPMAANPSVVNNTPSSTPAQPASDSHSKTHRPGQARRHRLNPHHSVQVEQRSTADRVRNLCCADQHLLANCNTCHLYDHLGCPTRHHQKVQTDSAPSATNRTTPAPST